MYMRASESGRTLAYRDVYGARPRPAGGTYHAGGTRTIIRDGPMLANPDVYRRRTQLDMEEQEMQIKVKKAASSLSDAKGRIVEIFGPGHGSYQFVTDKFTESMYVLANEPSVALYRLQEHVRRSLPELAQHKADMQNWEEQSQGSIYTVEYACSAVKSMTFSSVHFKSIEGLLKQAINLKHQLNTVQSRR